MNGQSKLVNRSKKCLRQANFGKNMASAIARVDNKYYVFTTQKLSQNVTFIHSHVHKL